MTIKYPKLLFSTETGNSCCGQLIVFDITAHAHKFDYVGGTTKKILVGHETYKGMVDDFLNRLNSSIQTDTEEHNDREGEENDCCYAFMSMTLYRGQHLFDTVDLIDTLIERGWTLMQEGVNPKTGNTIVNLGKNL